MSESRADLGWHCPEWGMFEKVCCVGATPESVRNETEARPTRLQAKTRRISSTCIVAPRRGHPRLTVSFPGLHSVRPNHSSSVIVMLVLTRS